MEVAHNMLEHKNFPDDNPKRGRLLSRFCHFDEHLQYYLQSHLVFAENSLRLIAQTSYTNGLHTFKFIDQFPAALENDRKIVVARLEVHNVNPMNFIDFSRTARELPLRD